MSSSPTSGCTNTASSAAGFGLLESGTVSTKNEVNIMVKNAVDVIAGGVSFWMFGYAFGFGKNAGWTAPFTGLSGFLLMGEDEQEEGKIHAQFFFQSSFATTATTIVSGEGYQPRRLQQGSVNKGRTRGHSYTVLSRPLEPSDFTLSGFTVLCCDGMPVANGECYFLHPTFHSCV